MSDFTQLDIQHKRQIIANTMIQTTLLKALASFLFCNEQKILESISEQALSILNQMSDQEVSEKIDEMEEVFRELYTKVKTAREQENANNFN